MTKRNMSAILMFLFGFLYTNLIATEAISEEMSVQSENNSDGSAGAGIPSGNPPVSPDMPQAPQPPKKPDVAGRDLPLSNNKQKLDEIRNLSFEQLQKRKEEVLRLLAGLVPDAERISTGFEQLKSELVKVIAQVSVEFESQIKAPLQSAQQVVTEMNTRRTELQGAINDLDKLKTALQKQYEGIRQGFGIKQQEYETLELQLTIQKENKMSLDIRNSELQTKINVANQSIKTLEINLAAIQSQISESSSDLKDLGDKKNKLESDYRAIQAELDRKDADYKAKSGELSKVQAQLQKVASSFVSTDKKNSDQNEALIIINDKLLDLSRNINALQESIRSSKVSLSQTENEFKLNKSLSEQLKKALEEARKQYLNAEKESKALNSQTENKNNKLNDVIRSNEKQRQLILETNNKISELSVKNGSQKFAVESLRKQITTGYENKAVYDQQLAEAVRTLIKFKSENDSLRRSIKELNDDMKQENNDLNKKLSELQKQGKEILKISNTLQNKGATMRSLTEATISYRQYKELIEKFNAEIAEAKSKEAAFEMQITQLDAARENLLQVTAAQSTAILNNPATADAVFSNSSGATYPNK